MHAATPDQLSAPLLRDRRCWELKALSAHDGSAPINQTLGGGMMGFCSRRDLEIENMIKDMAREEFILWRESVCTLVEMNEQ